MTSETITITFCDRGENHVGMEKLGTYADEGFSLGDLLKIKKIFEDNNCLVELYDLNYPIENLNQYPDDEAYFLIVRKGADHILSESGLDSNSTDLFEELVSLDWDSKALMYGRVVNKHARHNLCFASKNRKPNYAEGKGRIVSFKNLPLLNTVRSKIKEIVGQKVPKLVAEGNYYYDNTKCGIGYHGDAERKIVVGLRLGATIPLKFQWFQNSKSVGEKISFKIKHGDIYFMSEKATGNDWKQKLVHTLRHAAGSEKYC